MLRVTDTAAFLAGFVAAEGCFTRKGTAGFRFAVALGAADAGMCEWLGEFFGVGRVYRYARRQEHYDDEVVYAVQGLRELIEVIVPFVDEHLLPSHKRMQYEAWRADLLDYWERTAKRRRTCSVEGCSSPRRARGLCRGHYYAQYGR